ncbi:hypothetical protein RJ641_009685 [Dillenia turbinata]|uniref:Uncharacterized protein n=1 Tax=Dillenia turbinata TaxID=194707 RepID=A0AAN8V2G1_9MAGN
MLSLRNNGKNNSPYVSKPFDNISFIKKAEGSATPMNTTMKIDKDEEDKPVCSKLNKSMIGSLLYFTISSANILFNVCLYARFQLAPKIAQGGGRTFLGWMKAVKHFDCHRRLPSLIVKIGIAKVRRSPSFVKLHHRARIVKQLSLSLMNHHKGSDMIGHQIHYQQGPIHLFWYLLVDNNDSKAGGMMDGYDEAAPLFIRLKGF